MKLKTSLFNKSTQQSKLADLSQSNKDMQSYLDSKKAASGASFVPLIMLTEEMYKANFILDRWLKRKTGQTEEGGVSASSKDG